MSFSSQASLLRVSSSLFGASFFGVGLGLLLAGCQTPSGGGDMGSSDAATLKPSGCPAPAVIRPGDLQGSFLSGEDAFYNRTVDGDTAHFLFPSGDRVIRFLWVNTEEKSGAEATAFGMATVPIVEGWLAATSILTIVAERDPKQPSQPHLDAFDRTLSLVFTDGVLLQTKIVQEGLSAYYTQFGCAPSPVHEALLYAEAEARANQRGIWAPGHPTSYNAVFDRWIEDSCRPNPYDGPYCP